MPFYTIKVPGDILMSSDWNSFVDFTEDISSNAYRHSSNVSIHHTLGILDTQAASGSHLHNISDLKDIKDGWNSIDFHNSGIKWDNTLDKWIAMPSGGGGSGITLSQANELYYPSSVGVGLSGSFHTHISNEDIHYPSSQLTNWLNNVYQTSGTGVKDMDDLSDADTTTDPPSKDEVLKWNGTDWVPAAYDATFEFSIATFSDNELVIQLIGSGIWKAIGAITWNMTYNNGPPSSATITLSSDDGGYVPWITNPQIISLGAFDTSDEATNYPTVKDRYVRFALNAGAGGSPDSDTETVTFRNYIFYGKSNKNSLFTEGDVEGLASNILSNDTTQNWGNISPGVGEYLVLAYPSSYATLNTGDDYEDDGDSDFRFSGTSVAMKIPETVSITNPAGYIENYKVFASEQSNLGNHTFDTRYSTINYLYYGKTTTANGYNEADVEGLSNSIVTNDNTQTWNAVTTGVGEYMLFAFPVRLGTVTFWVGGFEGGFEAPETVSVTNANGWTEDYYVWRSTNTNLGSTVVTTV